MVRALFLSSYIDGDLFGRRRGCRFHLQRERGEGYLSFLSLATEKPLVFLSSFLNTGRKQAFSQFIFLPSLVEGKLFFGTLLIFE